MIRSSSHTLKFSNEGKLAQIQVLLSEYRRMLQVVIDHIWVQGFREDRWYFDVYRNHFNLPSMLPNLLLKEHFSTHTWLSARMLQAVGKQACSMLKAATKKHSKRLYILRKLQRKGENTRYLQRKIDLTPLVKPNASRAKAELDSRFLDFEKTDDGHFDFFLRLKCIGNKVQIRIPLKHTKVSRWWSEVGRKKQAVRLEDHRLHLIYDAPTVKPHGFSTVGADQGVLTALTLSDGQTTGECPHGHTLSTIQKKLSRRRHGSKGFKRAQAHRANYIGWSFNRLDFSNIKKVRLEKVKNLRRGRKSSRYLSHWTYTLIKQKLVLLSETEGFSLLEVPNEFRSQRCHPCGKVRKANRKGKTFKCDACGYTADSDRNAASNLELDLFEIPYWVRSKKINRKGFFWKPEGLFSLDGTPIVSRTQKF